MNSVKRFCSPRAWCVLAAMLALLLCSGCGKEGVSVRRIVEPEGSEGIYAGTEFGIADGVFPEVDDDGEPVTASDRALYDRLAAVSETLGVTFSQVSLGELSPADVLMTHGLGGKKAADVIRCDQTSWLPAAAKGFLLPVSGEAFKAAGLDPTDGSLWYQPTVTALRVFDHLWGLDMVSDREPCQTGFFLVYNRELLQTAGCNDLYQTVRDRKWTRSYYLDICRRVTRDTDGDGSADVWGTGTTASGCEIVSESCNYVKYTDGKWQFGLDSAEGKEALQFLYDLNKGSETCMQVDAVRALQAFADGRVAFCWCTLGDLFYDVGPIRQANHLYGIVPAPLGAEGEHYTAASDSLTLYVFPEATENAKRTADIFSAYAEAVTAEGDPVEAFTEDCCNTAADGEMLTEYIMPNFRLCLSRVDYDLTDSVENGLIKGITIEHMTPAEAVERYAGVIQKAVDDFFRQ